MLYLVYSKSLPSAVNATSLKSETLSPVVGLKRASLVSRATPSWRLTTRPGTKSAGGLQGASVQLEFGSIGKPVTSDRSLLRRIDPTVAASSGLFSPITAPSRCRLYRDWIVLVDEYSYSTEAREKTLRSSPVPALSKNGSLKSTS